MKMVSFKRTNLPCRTTSSISKPCRCTTNLVSQFSNLFYLNKYLAPLIPSEFTIAHSWTMMANCTSSNASFSIGMSKWISHSLTSKTINPSLQSRWRCLHHQTKVKSPRKGLVKAQCRKVKTYQITEAWWLPLWRK